MTQMIHEVLGWSVIALAACGASGSATGGDITGTVHGMAFPVADVISSEITRSGVAYVILSSEAGLCTPPDDVVYHPGEQTMVIILGERQGATTAAPSAPGTYVIIDPLANQPAGRFAILFTSRLDAACGNNADDSTAAATGAVTLTAVHGGAYDGTFDVVVEGDTTSEHLTGSFHSDACRELAAQLASEITPPCEGVSAPRPGAP